MGPALSSSVGTRKARHAATTDGVETVPSVDEEGAWNVCFVVDVVGYVWITEWTAVVAAAIASRGV